MIRKFTRQAIIIIALMTLGVTVAVGQPGKRGPRMPDSTQVLKTVDALAKAVELSAAQKDTITQIYLVHMTETRAQFEAARGKRSKMRELRRQNRDALTQKVNAVLQEEQKEKYNSFLEKQRERFRGRRPRR